MEDNLYAAPDHTHMQLISDTLKNWKMLKYCMSKQGVSLCQTRLLLIQEITHREAKSVVGSAGVKCGLAWGQPVYFIWTMTMAWLFQTGSCGQRGRMGCHIMKMSFTNGMLGTICWLSWCYTICLPTPVT